MQTRKRARSADQKRSARKLLEPVWDAVRGKDVDRLRAVLSDRSAELQGKLDALWAASRRVALGVGVNGAIALPNDEPLMMLSVMFVFGVIESSVPTSAIAQNSCA